MPIIISLDRIMKERKITSRALATKINITEANLSILKRGHSRAIRLSLLEKICHEIRCKPGELLTYVSEGES